jgi:hypothetical protein
MMRQITLRNMPQLQLLIRMISQQMLCHIRLTRTLIPLLTPEVTIESLSIQTKPKYIHRNIVETLPIAELLMLLQIRRPRHTMPTNISDSLQCCCHFF